MIEPREKTSLRLKTEKLVAELLDRHLADSLTTFLWWLDYNENVYSLQEFISFLEIAEVTIVLQEIDADTYADLMAELANKLKQAETT